MRSDGAEIERSFLKNLFDDAESLFAYMSKVDEGFFTKEARQCIFSVMKKHCLENREPITPQIVKYEIVRHYDDNKHKEFLFELELIMECDDKSPVEVLFRILDQARTERQVGGILAGAAQSLQSGKDVHDCINDIMTGLLGIGTDRKRSQVKPIHEYEDILQEIKDKIEHPERFRGIKSGFASYDKRTGGFHPAELVVFSAISSVGKSTMLKVLAFNLAYLSHKNVLFVSDEETNSEVRIKFAALATGLNAFDIREANVGKMEQRQIAAALSHISPPEKGELRTVEIPERSTASVIGQIYQEELQKGFKADAIVIDYLDRLAPSVKSYDQYDEQGKMVMDVKGLARRLNVVVLTATQSNASAEEKQRRGAHMNKTETHGSKKILHEADVLMFINFPEKGYILDQLKESKKGGDRETETDCDRVWRIEVAKHRTASCFDFYCQHHVRTGNVTEITKDDFEAHAGKQDDSGTVKEVGTAKDGFKIKGVRPEDDYEPLGEVEESESSEDVPNKVPRSGRWLKPGESLESLVKK